MTGTGLDTYQTCIQARFDTYHIPFLIHRKYREGPLKRAMHRALRLSHVRERKLTIPFPFDYSDLGKGAAENGRE